MFALWISLILGCQVYAQNYTGCLWDSVLNEDVPSPSLGYTDSSSMCIEECRFRYYMFAGVMNGQQCYCSSKFRPHSQSDNCTVIEVHATGQKGPSPPRGIKIDRIKPDTLRITWEPPDIPNGNLTSYTLHAKAIKTSYTFGVLPTIEYKVLGGSSNSTTLGGLQPGTKYNISIIASNTEDSGSPGFAIDWTPIGPPNKPATPKVIDKTKNTVTVELTEGTSEYGPVSAYQVVVVRPGTIPPIGSDVVYSDYDKSNRDGLGYYITGEFEASDFFKYKRFTVGNGKMIGGYLNVPLKADMQLPQIGLVVVSRVRDEVQYSYSNLTSSRHHLQKADESQMDSTAIALCVAIALLGILLIASILVYFILRRRHRRRHMRKLPEQQELTLQGPVYEVDNMAYIPEDLPERTNHYQELKNKLWNIPRNLLTIDAMVIQRGRFGTVHMGTVHKDGTPINVTVHSIADGLLKSSDKKLMLRELDVCIRAASTKYLAGLVGTCEIPDTLYVVMEMPPQTLKNRLLAARSGDAFPVEKMLTISASVASALRHLEHNKIVHNRLCARSVGLCSDWSPKVMGHGIAKYALEDVKYARWTAVECFENQKKHQPGVVWAFGVLLWEMLSMGGTPYANLNLESDVEEAITRGERLPQLSDVPDPLYEVMLSCWQYDPQERPTFDELIRLDTLSVCPISSITEPYIPELELN
ncbi:putative tyrosine-protein kinase Wsck [Cephus cinctus]|uniref:Tyrosine-protein kinase Wsck n=1 Tax=Cephus cinctus TaxID=211228 RepID=A0AAJ7C2D3_CEPCN|nr:putative tyrosine-protein kinase Wsck [Cephus cinctus]